LNEQQEMNVIQEIRSKVDIVDIVSEYVPLTQKGKNFFGVCPFHDDTNPSMSVSREKQIYRCFSCGASGNVFQFVQDYEHISFKEALKMLADKAGVELKGFTHTKSHSEQDKYYEIYEIAQKYYQNNLQTNYGKKAKEYLAGRKIDEEMIKTFGIGLSLDTTNDLVQLLTKKGYDLNTLNQIGLASYDKDLYNSRIMFPLQDLSGRIVGFSGRRYDGEKENKYVNTKGTPIFQKGNTLYHYFNAREAVRKKKTVIVMEGFMAAIRSITVGIDNVVSLMGTAMTKEQAELIKRLSDHVILCFDGDDAGRKATLTNGEELEKMGCEVKVAELGDDLDPDDYILKYGKDDFTRLIKNAVFLSDYKIKNLKRGVNLNSDEEIAHYINSVILETSKIKDEIRRELILKTLAKEFDIGYNTLEKRLLVLLEKEKTPALVEETIPKENKITIYLSALTELNIDNHARVSTTDNRLLRRIVRDNRTRGNSVENTLKSWAKVREGEEKYIFPYQDDAEYTFNTAHIYELGVLKTFVEPLLYSVPVTSEYYNEAIRLINFLRVFLPISSESIPEDSILREFIGGGCFKI